MSCKRLRNIHTIAQRSNPVFKADRAKRDGLNLH